MARFLSILAGLSLASITLSSPLQARQNGTGTASPCAQVSAAVAAVAAQATVQRPTVPAQLAYECINSVPFNQSAALALVDGVVPYFKWQSSTKWLKDPPREYVEKVQPAVDVWGGLQNIRDKVVGGGYENEFQFGFELYTLLQSTHDGHFVYIPDVVGNIFNFARPVPIVSVSSDGKSLPEIYVYADVLAESFGNATFKPSAISEINGIDAKEYLEKWSQLGSLQDRDALYNNVFYELAPVSLGPVGSGVGTFAGSGRGRWVYPGPTTELTFENGTRKSYDNYAKVLVPFTGVTDGASLYKKYLTGPSPESATPTPSPAPSPSPTPTPQPKPIPAPGYPPPVIREIHNLIGGYYLEDDYSDVAVLSVPSFVGSDEQQQFQDTAVRFLAAAKAAGKKKLVIDVQANGGGTILLGYDLYKLLFPNNIDHAAADRFRAFESTDILGRKFSQAAGTFPRVWNTTNDTLADLNSDIAAAVFNYRTDVHVDGENFSSWPDKFGPNFLKGDNFTNLMRWNLSDVLTPINAGINSIHGYGALSNYTTQPFAAEDVVVVTDGYCASTCTIFSELMRRRAGVKYISLGGRHRPGITQAIGGVKGTNNYPWGYIRNVAIFTIQNLTSSAEEAAQLNSTELGDYYDEYVFNRAAVDTSMDVNFRDGIRDGDDSNTPLQFIYEPADCRILYTKAMTVDITAIWKAVADTAWGGRSHCIAGGLGGHKSKGLAKRQLSVQDKVLSKRMHAWRRELSAEDYPLDVFTDLRGIKGLGDGVMWP